MHRVVRLLPAATLALSAVALTPGPAAASGPRPPVSYQRSCAAAPAGYAACLAIVRSGRTRPATTHPAATPAGYGPSDLQSAYALAAASAGAGVGQTVGIVDAYDDPNAAKDLSTYRSTFGLPPCTTANGCFRKVNQSGGTSYPRHNGGWAQEISLDLDMASAICPNCRILLVEAKTASFANLGAAEDTAVRLGATVVSNSYGGNDASDATYGSYYRHPGVAITASSGDSGYGVEYPASSDYVTAVGGTTLTRAGGTARGWTETAWSGAGSGCSAYNAQPSWQAAVNTGCSRRAVADVSADANPNTGVAVYDSFSYQGQSGWLVFGGTSVASPIIASVYALAGNAATVTDGSYPYAHPAALNDVTSGSNGTCSPSQLCTARVGWDGPTGLGTPNGTGGF